MNKRKLVLYGAAALVVVIAATFGSDLYFRNSSDWSDIRTLISNEPTVLEQVGRANNVSLPLLGFSYRSSGNWAHAILDVNVDGEKGTAKFSAEAERFANVWTLKRISRS